MKLGIISDIHEDIENLKNAFNVLERNSCDEIICLGDIVGFCIHYNEYSHIRNAKECLKLIKQNCKYVIAGNHDHYAARKIPEYRGGFHFPENWYDISIDERKLLSSGKVWLYDDELSSNLEQDDIEYINTLPEFLKLEINGIRCMFSHFVFPDITGSLTSFPKNIKDLSSHFDFMKNAECLIGFFGHVHTKGMMLGFEKNKQIIPILQDSFNFYSFGFNKLKNKSQCIALPAVTLTERKSGVTVFDVKDFSITTIKLK
ncbi:MAG: metallophosphoesterase [Bacteroidales bacterium]